MRYQSYLSFSVITVKSKEPIFLDRKIEIMKNNEQKTSYSVRTTAIIWGLATVMLGICIPLTKITKSGVILPLAVIIGASGGTVAVCRTSTRSAFSGEGRPNPNKITESLERFAQLETRIIDLETICSSQDFDRERKFKQLESE